MPTVTKSITFTVLALVFYWSKAHFIDRRGRVCPSVYIWKPL